MRRLPLWFVPEPVKDRRLALWVVVCGHWRKTVLRDADDLRRRRRRSSRLRFTSRRKLPPIFRGKDAGIAFQPAGALAQGPFVWAAIFCTKFRGTGEQKCIASH